VREALQRDLVEQPPGRATYRPGVRPLRAAQVRSIGQGLEHWGAYLRTWPGRRRSISGAEPARQGLNASIEDTLGTADRPGLAAGELSVGELRQLVGSLRELAQAKS